MPNAARILIADDEASVINGLSRTLKPYGYKCDGAADAQSALEKLRHSTYSVLIADLQMPGNFNLELVNEAAQVCPGLPIVILTGHPSLETAVQSVGSSGVRAYLTKPCPTEKLVAVLKSSVSHALLLKAVSSTRQRLECWSHELDRVSALMVEGQEIEKGAWLDSFLSLTTRNIDHAVADLVKVIDIFTGDDNKQTTCELFLCPTYEEHVTALREAVSTLEKTKSSFKSNELGDLRKKLGRLVD